MRRLSALLAFAAILLASAVGYTYYRRLHSHDRDARTPAFIEKNTDAVAGEWHWHKDDPETNCPIVQAEAKSFRAVHEPSLFQLTGMKLRLFNKGCSTFTYVQSASAQFDTWSGLMKSDGDVSVVMKVPADKSPDDKDVVANLIRVQTKGGSYETKSGKVDTDQPALFQFAHGQGSSVGVDYDPGTHILHMKSQVSLDWFGKGPASNAMHIEAGDVRYDEAHGMVYLTPWSKLKRGATTINGANSEVTLVDGTLHQVNSQKATGVDEEDTRHLEYSADQLIVLFDDDGKMQQLVGQNHAHLVATDVSSRTTVTSDRAELNFKAQNKPGSSTTDSVLDNVHASGKCNVESVPLPRRGVPAADTRILRSEIITLEMRPGGREIQTMRTDAPGQLEFRPNRPGEPHRTMDAERIRINYGEDNAIDTFQAANVKTRTDKPAPPPKNGKAQPAPPPAFTVSQGLLAKFAPGTNQIATLMQEGNFRYDEGPRHAIAEKAVLEQKNNRITLTQKAKVWDDTGTTSADVIVLNQQSGDMDALGHVATSRQPDQSKNGQSAGMLNESQPLQARAEKMLTRDDNFKIHYEGHSVLWQGANRLSAETVDIDRDEGTLHASGNVVSELVDKQKEQTKPTDKGAGQGKGPAAGPKSAGPIVYTVVHAPDMLYHDDERVADYTGGVKLVRGDMTMTAKRLRAFLTKEESKPQADPKNTKPVAGSAAQGDTSLDHAFGDGDVVIVQVATDRTRTGTSQHCEYYPKDDKVILNGGTAKLVDSRKGVTVGRQLTFFSKKDRLLVDGEANAPVVSDMLHK